ncbi:putative PH domain-containing protein [Escovopsis weberi]|uniref:Putative PH domain-containing protein n=1 Tax=Escovopsis weberi TaxID=150374 RepID=A0A0M8MTI7_ESCWE|nr:putative PH domain-containing protein [Escovopsis weberi]
MAATCLKLETRRPPEDGVAASRAADSALNRCSRVTLNPTALSPATPVNQKGCFEFDRLLKCGYVQKRTRRTKTWKSVYLVLRADAVSLYKNDKENKLRHQIYLADLSAVTFLRDPKGKRKNLFGLFSSSRNFHFEAPTAQDAQEWVDLIRNEARLEEEEEEMVLNGYGRRSISPVRPGIVMPSSLGQILDNSDSHGVNVLSSSTENHSIFDPPNPNFMSCGRQRMSSTFESSGLSCNDMPSNSDFSDLEVNRNGTVSCENLAVQPPVDAGPLGAVPRKPLPPGQRPPTAGRSASQSAAAEQESERVIWQGWLWRLQSKGGVRQWKDMWGVLRGRNLVLYKDENEYSAQWIADVTDVVDVVDIDPLSKSKTHCLQIITEEKSYRFCAHDEESLVLFIGAFKSLLAKRRSLGNRASIAMPSL